MIKIKRVYDKVDESDGYRILVDRLWPRGLTKSEAQISDWQKTIAPSEKLMTITEVLPQLIIGSV